jgi:HAD superfamily hydrolase (TIGR01509 family)
MAIAGLIFDMDGVIVDSTEVHRTVWERYLEPLGVDSTAIGERMHGKHNDEIVRELFPEERDPEAIVRHGAAKEALYRASMATQLEQRLVPGIREFLERRKGIPMAVASNAEPANVEFVLERAGLRRFFAATIDGHAVKHPKPAPDIYIEAASLLGAAPADCVIFEDSVAGVTAAMRAGARVVGITTTCKELPYVDLTVADFTDTRLEEWLQVQA